MITKSAIKIQACLLILSATLVSGTIFASLAAGAEACEEWVAKIVSMQGDVQALKSGEKEWQPVRFSNTFCIGDMLRVLELGRAAIILDNDAIIRLDQNTTIIFGTVKEEQTFMLKLLNGVAHIFSRKPRSLEIITPFVNAGVEGTEFLINVDKDQAVVTVFEGQVQASNVAGSLTLTSGQSAITEAGQAPAFHTVVRPRDAVQWALYYPPVLHFLSGDFSGGAESDWRNIVRNSIHFYMEGNLTQAFSSIEKVPEKIRDPRFFNYRAMLLLSVGRVDEARSDIEQSLNLEPGNSHALALLSIIAVVQNEKDKALGLARKAVAADPDSATPRIALSYALQANFQLEAALKSLQEAVKLAPENSLAWARLAELWLSFGNLDKALESAKEALKLNPDLARTQTVLGFAYLAQIKTRESIKAFEQAIKIEQAAPLPRLGLGLAKIREGDLKGGRQEIEIAASLDPNNSLIRSYLGKAYFEEKRDKKAAQQFAIAKELDPLDPTSFFYDAIRKQSINRPVEALHDLQESIELNDNRAIYRSRLLLDEDLAARSASLARIYNNLGFQQLALVEGWRSVTAAPDNFSAHRFLADSYAALPRHEIARVSELLQSQLLQPINITPVQPKLAEGRLFILNGAGPGDLSFNEFNSLFNRNRIAMQLSGVVGENDTRGNEVVLSGVYQNFSLSAGQFHYETDGFRKNNDQEQDIYNVFVQANLSYKTSVLAEFRAKDTEEGDLRLNFDPEDFYPELRGERKIRSIRTGLRHSFTPCSDIIATVIYIDFNSTFTPSPSATLTTDEYSYMAEAQHLFSAELFNVTSGAGYFSSERHEEATSIFEVDTRHTNLYGYGQIHLLKSMTWTVGGSADFYDGYMGSQNQFNPKLGITWNPRPSTTLRAAAFRVLTRTLVSEQTLEPTQVAGFNQFFDDGEGTDSWRYGVAIDQKFTADLYGGVEISKRELEFEVPPPDLAPPPPPTVMENDWEEQLGRAYLYWTPNPFLALSAEYQYEKFDRQGEIVNGIEHVKTHTIPLGINFFHPSGFSVMTEATYRDQEGDFVPEFAMPYSGSDQFWIVDASIGYRLPQRLGRITIGARNLFDTSFKFQDTDPVKPEIQPDRLLFVNFTLAL